MKLGSRPDSFYSTTGIGNGNARTVSVEVPTDYVVEVKDTKFLLHKFPLLSKSGRLQKLAAEAHESKNDKVSLNDIPGGAKAFEFCAKFCYGIIVTVSALNIVSARCAAEYLEMTEGIEKGNLTLKLDTFLNSSILNGWKDSIITLHTTKSFLPWSENLKIIGRCIDAVAWKALTDPENVDWSFTYTKTYMMQDQKSFRSILNPTLNEIHSQHYHLVPKDWWVEDISELEIDLYWRIMVAIKSTGKISHEILGEALRVYAFHWLPGLSKEQRESAKLNTHSHSTDYVEIAEKHRFLLETIVSLLPPEKNSTSCSFLLKLLKAATILGASVSSKTQLARRIGLQLEDAELNDLLIPSLSYASETLYDVDLVQTILEYFMRESMSPPTSPVRSKHTNMKRRSRSAEFVNFVEKRISSATYNSKLKVAKLVDTYLGEIARDSSLSIPKFVALAEIIPDFARPVHDDLYRAIDTYLKEHPGLTKSERKRICRLLDCKKLSVEACMHAAQNEQLPLRVVVQVLFFDQVRAAMSSERLNMLPANIKALLAQEVAQSSAFKEELDSGNENFESLRSDLANMKLQLAESEKEHSDKGQEVAKSTRLKGICSSIPSKSKRILSRIWSNNWNSNKKHRVLDNINGNL